MFNDFDKKIQNLMNFFNNLKHENRIILTLKYCLAMGNYLNGITTRGGAWGFKLESFEKFSDLKASDGKHTLLMHVLD